MANPRAKSMVAPATAFEDSNENPKRKSAPLYGHSSSSSIDSAGGQNVHINGQNSSPQNPQTTTSSTTTDSDFESEQDDSLQSQRASKADSSAGNHLDRRIKHFRKLFESEISSDMPQLIDSYVCAYQGDILLQGKMYITDRYLCFHSRIINYVTKHVYRWEDIEHVAKERVAFIFPTAIAIQLRSSGKKIIYASFIQRDQAFEKIHATWSKFSNGNHAYDGEDDDIAQDGTLKATHSNDGPNYSARRSFEFAEDTEQDVLKMCLKQSQKRPVSLHAKSSDEKPLAKKLDKKNSGKYLEQDSKRTSERSHSTQPARSSRYIKRDAQSTEKSTRSASTVNHRSQSAHRPTPRADEAVLPAPSSSAGSSLASTSNSSGIVNKLISFLNQICQSLATLTPSFRVQTTVIILLVLAFLFFHSFYLIKLAFRIENRLQSLNHRWPASSSPMKSSFSSNAKDL